MNRIELKNRNRLWKVWLERGDEKSEWWEIKCGDPEVMNYGRFGYEEDPNHPYFFDLPDGPMLCIGDFLVNEKYRITEIRNTSLGVWFKLNEEKEK